MMKVEILSLTHELKSHVFHKAVTQDRSFCSGKQGEMEEVTSSASRLTHYALLCDEEDPANALSGQQNGEQHEVLWMKGAEGKRKGDSFVNGSKLHSTSSAPKRVMEHNQSCAGREERIRVMLENPTTISVIISTFRRCGWTCWDAPSDL